MSTSTKHIWNADPLSAIWPELKTYVERVSKELYEDVRHYPTPIARCDEQLTKLIEQRRQAGHLLHLVIEASRQESSPTAHQLLQTAESFLHTPEFDPYDGNERALRSRLKAALTKLRGQP